MAGFIYLIRNGDLHKIGITRNLERRMRELAPGVLIAQCFVRDPEKEEKRIHRYFRHLRIPQTEYFRLTDSDVDYVCCAFNCETPAEVRQRELVRQQEIQRIEQVRERLRLERKERVNAFLGKCYFYGVQVPVVVFALCFWVAIIITLIVN